MIRIKWLAVALLPVAMVATVVLLPSEAEETESTEVATTEKEAPPAEEGKEEVEWAPAVESKPLSENVKTALGWIVDHQLESGGWGQGEESSQMRGSMRIFRATMNATPDSAIQRAVVVPELRSSAAPVSIPPEALERSGLDRSAAPVSIPPEVLERSVLVRSSAPLAVAPVVVAQNTESPKPQEIASVADTCMAALALIRSGSTPSNGPYSKNIAKAVRFLCAEIEESDADSLYITKTRGTRVQSKLGPYIDTFLAAMLLPEVVDQMSTKKENKRVEKALAKVMKKMEKNQRDDGTWSDQGWAATLSQGAAVKAMNRVAQNPKVSLYVSEDMRERAEQNAQGSFDNASGKFTAKGSAGVELYSASANLSALGDSVNTNGDLEAQAEEELKNATDDQTRQQATAKLERFKQTKADRDAAQNAVIKRLDDKNFIAGFGNNGGEEFLSYMNIGESLVVSGGEKWKTWDKSITENLNRVQNDDGSWTGHHCITGRTFCTSAALLVLMVDRAPFPVSKDIKRR